MKKPDFSIIIPAYKEAAVIDQMLEQTAAFLDNHPKLGSCEVIVVAAEAHDNTADLAKQKTHLFKNLRVIEPGKKVGKGRDVRAGMLAATGKKRLFMDADLATPLHHIPKILEKLDHAKVVIGRRNLQKVHEGFLRRLLSVCGNWLIRFLVLPGLKDSQCGFKGFSRLAAETLFARQRVMGWGFDIELLAQARRLGYKIVEIDIPDWKDPRVSDLRGESGVVVALRTLLELLYIRLHLWRDSLKNPRTKTKFEILLVALGLLIATGLYVTGLARSSLWFDEAFSAQIIQQSFQDIIRFTAADVHPPLYYFVLKAWTGLFGTTEVALRSLSVIFSVTTVAVSYALIRRLFGRKVALIALVPVLLAPFLLRYAQEARMYALAALICISATYALVRAEKGSKKWWTLYSILVAAGLYTHYFTALIWITHWVWRFAVHRFKKGILQPEWLLANMVALGLFLPWLPIAIDQMTTIQTDGFWIKPLNLDQLGNVATGLLIYVPGILAHMWQIGLVVLAIAAITFLTIYTFRHIGTKKRPGLLLLALYSVVPLLVLVLVSLPPRQSVFAERYFAHTSIGLYLLVGVSLGYFLLSKARMLYKVLVAGLLIGTLIYGLLNVYATSNMNFSNLRASQAQPIIFYINQHAQPEDGIFSESYIYYELAYYRGTQPFYFYDAKREVAPKGGQAMLHGSPQQIHNLTEFGQEHPGVWYVTLAETVTNIPESWRTTREQRFGEYKITLYKTTP